MEKAEREWKNKLPYNISNKPIYKPYPILSNNPKISSHKQIHTNTKQTTLNICPKKHQNTKHTKHNRKSKSYINRLDKYTNRKQRKEAQNKTQCYYYVKFKEKSRSLNSYNLYELDTALHPKYAKFQKYTNIQNINGKTIQMLKHIFLGCYTKQTLKRDLQLTERTYQRILKRLKRNGWILTFKGSGINIYLNPFIRWNAKRVNEKILTLANENLFDVLSFPLIKWLNEKILDVKFVWSFRFYNHLMEFPNNRIWNGVLTIQVEKDNGFEYTFLPFNIHYQGRGVGIPHITLPIKWEFFGIQEAKRLRNGGLFIHFDNSVRLMLMHDSGAYLNFKDYLEGNTLNWFGRDHYRVLGAITKQWKNFQYVETRDFETHETLIRNRLIHKLVDNELLESITEPSY